MIYPNIPHPGVTDTSREAAEHIDAPKAIVFPESPDNSQLRNTQIALRNLYRAVQKSRAVNDPLGMATAMEEAGKWF